MDISFVIELDGSMTSFQVYDHYFYTESNENYFSQLRDYAFRVVKETEHWNPGQIQDNFVRTRQGVRVYFISKN